MRAVLRRERESLPNRMDVHILSTSRACLSETRNHAQVARPGFVACPIMNGVRTGKHAAMANLLDVAHDRNLREPADANDVADRKLRALAAVDEYAGVEAVICEAACMCDRGLI